MAIRVDAYWAYVQERKRQRGSGVAAPTEPARFDPTYWSVVDAAAVPNGGTLTVTVSRLPYDGGAAITDIEYRVSAGGWVSSGLAAVGTFDITGLTNATAYWIGLRAVNALGKAAADYSFGGSTPQFIIDDAAQYYLSQTGKTAASARTVTMTDPVTVRDSDGLWKHSAHNLIPYPDVTDANWTKLNAGTASLPVITDAYAAGPNGGTAARVQLALNGGTTTADYSTIHVSKTVTAGVQVDAGFWAKTVDGSTVSVLFRDDAGASFAVVQTITGSWQYFIETGSPTGTAFNFRLWLRGAQGTSDSADILIADARLYRSDLGGMQNNPDTGTSFVGGTGTGPFFARPVEYAMDGSASMPIAPGRTQLIPNSQFDGAVIGVIGSGGTLPTGWSQSGWDSFEIVDISTYNGVPAIRVKGLLNNTSGSTVYPKFFYGSLTGRADNTTFAVQTSSKVITATVDAGPSVLVQDVGGTIGNFVSLVLTSNGAWNDQSLAGTTGTGGTALNFLYTNTVNDLTNATLDMWIAAPMFEQGAFASPYIPTNGAVTSRAAIQASTAKAMIGSDAALAKGTWVMAVQDANGIASGRILNADASGIPLYQGSLFNGAANWNSASGTLATGGVSWNGTGTNRISISFEDGVGRSITADGLAAVTDTKDYLSSNPPPNFWYMQTGAQANMPGGSMIRGVMFPDRLSDANIASITDAATIYPSWGEKSATPTDAVAPTLDPPVLNTTTNAVDLTNVSEAGTMYALINYSAAVMSGATIDSQVTAGSPDAYVTSAVSTGTTNVAIDKSGVTPGTAYLHVTIKDAAGNYSTDAPVTFTQPAPFSPLDLFAASEKGIWFDPSNIASLWTDAGTTQVTADGDVVGQMDDLSGNAKNATQTTTSLKPLYKVDVNGNPYILFDGVDDVLNLPNLIGIAGSQNRTIFFAGKLPAVEIGSGAGALKRWAFRQEGTATNLRIEIQTRGYTSAFNAAGPDIFGVVFNGTTLADHVLHRGLSTEAATGTDTLNTTDSVNTLGLVGNGGTYYAMACYGLVYIDRVLTAQEISDLKTYLANKAGVTLV